MTVVGKESDSFFVSLFEFQWGKDMFCGGKVERESGLHRGQSRQRKDVTEVRVSLLISEIRL